MATQPLTAGDTPATAQSDTQIGPTPAADEWLEVVEGELSSAVAGRQVLAFDTGDDDDNRVMGGEVGAGGGSAAVRTPVRGPVGVALFYTSDITGAQTIWVRFRLVKV